MCGTRSLLELPLQGDDATDDGEGDDITDDETTNGKLRSYRKLLAPRDSKQPDELP